MSITPIHSGFASPVYAPRPRVVQSAAVAQGGAVEAPTRVEVAQRSLPAEAPEQTDSTLWGVLSSDERAYFARASSTGAVTYGPGSSGLQTSPAVSLGGRIDLKV